MAKHAKGWLRLVFLLGLFVSGLVVAAGGEGAPPVPPMDMSGLENHRCLRCHADQAEKHVLRPDGSKNNIFVDKLKLEGSVHGKVACVGCHRDVTKLPHSKPLGIALGPHCPLRRIAIAPMRLPIRLRRPEPLVPPVGAHRHHVGRD